MMPFHFMRRSADKMEKYFPKLLDDGGVQQKIKVAGFPNLPPHHLAAGRLFGHQYVVGSVPTYPLSGEL